jgi:hypothetical protein
MPLPQASEFFLFPGSAWEHKGQQQAGRACLAVRARAEPGHEG